MSEQKLIALQARPRAIEKLVVCRQILAEVRVGLKSVSATELEQVLARWKQRAPSSQENTRSDHARASRRASAARRRPQKHARGEQMRNASNHLSDENTLVLALSEGQTYAPDEALRLEIEALQRAFARRKVLLQGSLTAPQVALLLGTTRQTPHDRAQRQTLLAVEDRGILRFPYWQFDANGANGIIAGLPAVLKALDISRLGKASWLTRPNPYLNGRTPLEALKSGEVERVVDQARAVGAGG